MQQYQNKVYKKFKRLSSKDVLSRKQSVQITITSIQWITKMKQKIIHPLPYEHTATGIVDLWIQTIIGFLFATFEDLKIIDENLNRAPWKVRM